MTKSTPDALDSRKRMFSIILVSYNSAAVLGDALASVPAGQEVIVVDNASTDNSAAVARAMGAICIQAERNLGFGTACNLGARRASSEFLLFLNPDAKISADTLERLEAAFHAYPKAAALTPRILHPDGTTYFAKRNRLIAGYPELQQAPQADRSIPLGVGAALAVRKDRFEELGGFDENIFLYFEDVDLSARIILSGYEIMHIHDAIAHHLSGHSSGDGEAISAFKAYHFVKADIYVRQKFGLPQERVFRRLKYTLRYWYHRLLTGNAARAIELNSRLRALSEPLPNIARYQPPAASAGAASNLRTNQ